MIILERNQGNRDENKRAQKQTKRKFPVEFVISGEYVIAEHLSTKYSLTPNLLMDWIQAYWSYGSGELEIPIWNL